MGVTAALRGTTPFTTGAGVRRRPAMFRALGRADPPPAITLDGETFRRAEILKHDSWAATAVYRSPSRVAKCKFNRTQPIGLVPMRWLGKLLARRERWFMSRLAGIEGVPKSLGVIHLDGRAVKTAIAHEWIPGHALTERERVTDAFFPQLLGILEAVHRRGVAHVDLHKRENILVDEAGRPCLIDYQISFGIPTESRVSRLLFGGVLRLLQRSDDYHLLKHRLKHRPDQVGLSPAEFERLRPWWIRAHRCVAVPFRTVRRRLLTALGIRSKTGHAFSEAFPEVAHRRAA